MKSGVRAFDTGLGGRGRLLATERLVLLCSRMGIGTPLDSTTLRALRAEPEASRGQPSASVPAPCSPTRAVASRVPESE